MTKRVGNHTAVYNANGVILTDGDETGSFVDINGNTLFSAGTSFAGEDILRDVQKVEQRYTNTRITGDGLVQTGVGQLHAIIVSQPASATPTAGVLTVYDNTAESGTVLFQHYFPASAVPTPVTIPINGGFSAGLYFGFDATLAGLAFNALWS